MKNNTLIVVATKEEIALVDKYAPEEFKGAPIIITGVGGLNVYQALATVRRNTKIFNVGFAGSIHFPVGEARVIGKSALYHQACDYTSPEYTLSGNTLCLTSTDFIAHRTKVCVQDMELAFIMAMGFEDVTSIKIVSDKHNHEEYNAYTSKMHK